MKTLALLLALFIGNGAVAAADKYDLDPHHTYPSFEADHFGLSIWRGKFNASSGTLWLDKTTGAGSVEVIVDLTSVDFGHDKLNAWAASEELFDVARYPQARYKGRIAGSANGIPAQVDGELTLHGVTRPVMLTIRSFKCIEHPMLKRDYCGADALGVFQRDEFGLDAGKPYGFDMTVTLRIQVEAIKAP
jgi:polyisoprenoid-binding protein YceI